MDEISWQKFPSLEKPCLKHGFSLRSKATTKAENDAAILSSLIEQGIPSQKIIQGEQPHSNQVKLITAPTSKIVPEVDALITKTSNLALTIRVADCGAVYFYDPVHQAIGLAHSGRKGTELNIVAATIDAMKNCFQTVTEDLIVQLSPCIRPPHYEVNFAQEIQRQARETGVQNFYDCNLCTACDLSRYYSYRAEKGKTSRMWAFLMLAGHEDEFIKSTTSE